MSYICDYFPHKQLQGEKTAVKSVDFTPIQIKKKAYCIFIIIIIIIFSCIILLFYIATSLVT